MSTKPLFPTSAHKKARVRIPEMVSIPSGDFMMGTSYKQIEYMLEHEPWADEWHEKEMFHVEQPYHKVFVPAFEIARHPVTNFEYHLFIWESGYRAPKTWLGFHYTEEVAFHPVAGVSREDALAYCEWLQKALVKATGEDPENFIYRLPSEAEWERAARGDDDRIYPWGNDFDPWRCNTADSRLGGTSQVGCYSPSGDSPCEAADLAGNVWEMTGTVLRPYPYKPDDGREDPSPNDICAIRGGAWYYSHKLARCTSREGVLRGFTSPALGFRLARTPLSK